MLVALALVTADVSAQARLQGPYPPVTTRPAESEFGGGIVQDPSFEAGTPNPFWVEASSNFGTPLCTNAACAFTNPDFQPHTGTWWAWFGGTNSAEAGSVEQSVTIPAGAADLTYWLRIPTAAIPGTLTVSLGGTTLATYTQADQAAYATWTLVTIPVNSFAGGTHLLRFAQQNAAGPANQVINFFIDDVQIEAVPEGPSLNISPTTVGFGGVEVGTTSTPQTVTLTNNGTAPVTIASITGSGAPFSVTFSPTAAGSASGTVTITSNAPGSPHTVALTGTGQNFITYESTDTPLPIPDGDPTGVTSTITVPAGAPTVGDVDVRFDATHGWIGDMRASVSHNGTTVMILDRPGVSPSSQFGCSGDNPQIIADDEGTDGSLASSCTSANPGYPVVFGRYTPNEPLSAFDGMQAAGTWTLTVIDPAEDLAGTLNSWALLVTPSTIVAGEGGPEAGAFRLAVAPNPVVGSGQATLVVPTAQDVRVALYDALGRQVRVLFEGAVAAGQQAYIAFTTSGLAPGAYVLRASGEGVEAVQRVTVAR